LSETLEPWATGREAPQVVGPVRDVWLEKVMLTAFAIKRLTEPEEIAEPVTFLCAPEVVHRQRLHHRRRRMDGP
jgi:NAD(P)-dependent dehydrogenase (short-subunit alcohol dehydrogenase family)